ncbi:MAG: hypothetical protein PVH19_15265 [Planctomycetia bacterium]|jgi:hypothetical protein
MTAKSSTAKNTKKTNSKKNISDEPVTIDRRRKQVPVKNDRRKSIEPREKVSRRRQIDPTTCERDYSNDEVEFMNALDEYKRTSGRMFPTCSEVLEVLKNLGYCKMPTVETIKETSRTNGMNQEETSNEMEEEALLAV